MNLKVAIVSAEKELYQGEAKMVVATADLGEVGILPRHTPMLTRLKPGQVRILLDETKLEPGASHEEVFYISGGTMEVQPDSVTVLADTAERAKDLDLAAVEEAKRDAEKVLSEQSSAFEYAQARATLAETMAQLQAIQKLRKGSKH